MKIKNFLSSLMASAMIACAMVSCADLAGIGERLDNLESDVKALQGQIAAVHANFETLQSLKGAIVISEVDATVNGYKITLSNGEVLELSLVAEDTNDEILGAIEVSETEVKITLADGEVVNVPVVEDFKFAVTYNGSVVTDVQEFSAGDVMEYAVEQSNVASAAIVACPAGFKVVLEETKLIVTATGEAATKATASSENEIAILAVSKSGHSVLTKLIVELTKVSAAKVKLTGTSGTYNSATFTVEFNEDAVAYAYLCLESTETAPSVKQLAALEAKTDAEFTIEDLKDNTSYRVYVAAKDAEGLWGSVVAYPFITAKATDFDLYNSGMDIVIGGLTINKLTYGEATLITNASENKVIGAKGVFFIDSAAEDVKINNAEALIVIGLGNAKPNITKENTVYINKAQQNYAIFKDVTLSITPTNGDNLLAPGGSESFPISELIFDGCKINIPSDKNLFYSKYPINSIVMTDSDVKVAASVQKQDKCLFSLSATTTVESVKINNNIFYCNEGDVVGHRIINGNNITISSLEFKYNTIAKIYPFASYGYISCNAITTCSIANNLFYIPEYSSKVNNWTGIIRMPENTDETGVSIKSNLAFYDYDALPSPRMKASFYRQDASGELYNKAKTDNPIPSPDYANGVFTQGEGYTSYGAKR